MTDAIAFGLAQLQDYGLKVDKLELGPPPGGKAWRVPHEDDKRGKKSGWYVAHLVKLHDDREAVVGGYGRFVGAEHFREKFQLPEKTKLNEFDRHRIKQEQKRAALAAEQAGDEAATEAAGRASELWGKLPSCSESAYLTKKGVSAFGLARGRDGVAVVPMRSIAGAVVGLQFIAADGGKKFLSGQRTSGAFHVIGTPVEGQPIVLAEGYATAASIHMATSWPVVVCFNASNLVAVAPLIRQKWPEADLVIAGDDDHDKKENAGRRYSVLAADKSRATVVFPSFKEPAGKTDFNDLHSAEGLDAVAAQLQKAYKPHRPADAGKDAKEPWRKDLVWDEKGLKVTKHNLILMLENDPRWQGVMAYDEFARQVVKRKPTPYGAQAGPMDDSDDSALAAWFERKDTWRLSVATSLAREAALVVAFKNRFHPIRDYLDSLKWDQKTRIPGFFEKHCGVVSREAAPEHEHAAPREVVSKFALNFFIAAVARIYRPGCKADLMLVLEGEQGRKKSSLVEVLAGGSRYYVDLGTSPADKDFYQIIQGRWLVEISELASFAKADTSHIKRAVSSHVDTFRPSYGRYVHQFPRECLFMGTANDSDWNKDPTGGRRFMPLWVDQEIDFAAIEAIRDQLWAEAVVRFRDGEEWWVLPAGAQEEQESRYTEDPWVEAIVAWLDGEPIPRQSATVPQIMEEALKLEVKKQDRVAQRRVGELMRRLGWKRKQKRVGAQNARSRVWEYKRPDDRKVSSA